MHNLGFTNKVNDNEIKKYAYMFSDNYHLWHSIRYINKLYIHKCQHFNFKCKKVSDCLNCRGVHLKYGNSLTLHHIQRSFHDYTNKIYKCQCYTLAFYVLFPRVLRPDFPFFYTGGCFGFFHLRGGNIEVIS